MTWENNNAATTGLAPFSKARQAAKSEAVCAQLQKDQQKREGSVSYGPAACGTSPGTGLATREKMNLDKGGPNIDTNQLIHKMEGLPYWYWFPNSWQTTDGLGKGRPSFKFPLGHEAHWEPWASCALSV